MHITYSLKLLSSLIGFLSLTLRCFIQLNAHIMLAVSQMLFYMLYKLYFSIIIVPIFQKRKLRPREVKRHSLSLTHTTSEWQNWHLNLGSLAWECALPTTVGILTLSFTSLCQCLRASARLTVKSENTAAPVSQCCCEEGSVSEAWTQCLTEDIHFLFFLVLTTSSFHHLTCCGKSLSQYIV